MKRKKITTKKYFMKELVAAYIYSVLTHIFIFLINIGKSKGLSTVIVSATNGEVDSTVTISLVLLLSIMVAYFANFFVSVVWNDKVEKHTHRCKMLIQKNVLSRKLSYLNNASVGKILENLTDDLSTAIDYCSNVSPKIFCAAVQIIIYGIYFMSMNPVVVPILTGIAVLQIVPPIIVKRHFEKYYDDTRNIEAEITEQIIQGYNGLSDIKRQNAKKWVIKRFSDLHKVVYKIDIKNQKLLQGESSMDNLLSNVLLYGTYACIGMLTLNKTLTLDVALQIIVLSSPYYSSYKDIFDSIPEVGIANLAFERLSAWFNRNEVYGEIKSDDNVAFTNFSYTYTDMDNPIFSNLSISFSSKEVSIITGANGTGKSTLMKQLVGLLSTENGNISFCGMNPDHLSDAERSEYLFYLPQEPPCFNLTPLSLFDSFNPDNVEVCEKLAERFGLTNKVLKTCIADLSGGERKKVYLSLAFSTTPDTYLLLDEPTNSLDQNGISAFISLLSERQGGAMIISHNQQITELPYNIFKVDKGGNVYEEHIS